MIPSIPWSKLEEERRKSARRKRIKYFLGFTLAFIVPTGFVTGAIWIYKGWDKAMLAFFAIWLLFGLVVEGIRLLGGKR